SPGQGRIAMILERLNELGRRFELEDREAGEELPPSYKRQRIAWLVQIDGSHAQIIETSAGEVARSLAVPSLRRSGTAAKPLLLADKAEFVFGLPVDGSSEKRHRAEERHRNFLALTQACHTETK